MIKAEHLIMLLRGTVSYGQKLDMYQETLEWQFPATLILGDFSKEFSNPTFSEKRPILNHHVLLCQNVVASKSKSTCQWASVFSGILTESAFFKLIFLDLVILLFGLICDSRYRIEIRRCVSLTRVIDVLNRLSFR